MITRTDCLLLLSELSDSGIDTKEQTEKLIKTSNVVDCIKFINEHRQLDLSNFYEKLRKSYNKKKSKLYINIVKESEDNVITTLSSLGLQISLFKPQDEQLFFKSSRIEEIHNVLLNYFKTYDLVPAIQLLKVIKADLKVFEGISQNN